MGTCTSKTAAPAEEPSAAEVQGESSGARSSSARGVDVSEVETGTSWRKKNVAILPEHVRGVGSEAYSPPVFAKSEASTAIIRGALDNSLVFSGLDAEQKQAVVASMAECGVERGSLLIKQGDPGDAFYVVESGRFDILVDGTKVAEYTAGGSFGELALIMNRPRAATVLATEQSLCWKIDRKPFRYFLASSSNSTLDEIVADLKKVKVLEGLPVAHLTKLAAHATKERFPEGERIIRKGEQGDKFYMLKKGVVECRNIGDGASVVELAAGGHFGELALTSGSPRACDVVAKTEAECITLSKQDFEALLGPVTEAMERTHCVNVVRGLPGFGSRDWSRVYEALEAGSWEAGATVHATEDAFYLITKGAVEVSDERRRRVVKAQEYFGSEWLVDEKSTWLAATVVGEAGAAHYYALRASALARQRGASSTALVPGLFDSKYARLRLGRTLGTGTFGRVKLATGDGESYAVKLLVKQAMVDLNQAESVELERQILIKLGKHPFVLTCHATFQTADVCYFVLDFVQGGELFSRVEGGVDEREAAFHSACVLDALDHIHAHHVVYRDLKPENVLLDARGYARVVDFGFAKHLETSKKTYTILGTPEYLSPECVLGRGYGYEVDLWAFGVLAYETLTGRSPFYAQNPDDTMAVFRLIVAAHVKFTKRVSPKAESFVTSLLARDAKSRLGARSGELAIKAHPFLAPFADFDALRDKTLTAPYVPKLASNTDASHFDAYSEDLDVRPYSGSNDFFANFGPTIDRPFS